MSWEKLGKNSFVSVAFYFLQTWIERIHYFHTLLAYVTFSTSVFPYIALMMLYTTKAYEITSELAKLVQH